MSTEVKASENNQGLKISGPLNVDTVVRLRELCAPLLKTVSETIIDLQQVTECDSTALALLTALARDAKKLGKQARFVHVPSQLMAIARLSDLEKVLVFD